MSEIHIGGFRRLRGEIPIQGSKNGVLPMMAASVLSDETTVLTNVPAIQDVDCMMGILKFMGCRCTLEAGTLTIDPSGMKETMLPECYVRQMRSSIVLLGAMLGRFGQAATCYPGGCSIGKRPVDFHIMALRSMGARISEEDGRITARAELLTGSVARLPYPSVGATENAILAAVTARGTTVIQGAAREPEIQELCGFLNAMGAEVRGGGTGEILIQGKRRLHGCCYQVPGDRIVAGTYLIAAMAGKGEVRLNGVNPEHLSAVSDALTAAGAEMEKGKDFISVVMKERPQAISIATEPYPGFPTDLQSPLMALLCCGQGESRICENVFEGRYETAAELCKLGADIRVSGNTAVVFGKDELEGGYSQAKDLRGGAALVIAGLMARGETIISDCFHIERGYEDICRDLRMAGADIQWQEERPKEKEE